MNKNRVIERVKSELLFTLLNYVAPFIERKIKSKDETPNNLEKIVNRPEAGVNDIRQLESLLMQNLNKSVKLNKKSELTASGIFYSLEFIRQKINSEKSNDYSISIKYSENEREDKLEISIKQAGKEVYSSEITTTKESKSKIAPYSINISYEDNYSEERLSISYKQQLKNYLQQHINSKEDMSSRVPLKWLNILPEAMMGGVLGFTYLGENFMGRRADLTGKTARMVDIHESIHTPDEYETRILTDWIMQKPKMRYVR